MKITLSKLQWEFIGKKTGWIKKSQSDIVEIDGVSYALNEEGQIVPVPPKPPKSTTISVIRSGKKINVTFTENKEYKNYYGVCKIDKIYDNNTMDITYITSFNKGIMVGNKTNYSMQGQAESIVNEQYRQNQLFRRLLTPETTTTPETNVSEVQEEKQTIIYPENYYFTIGYIAQHGFILAEVPPNAKEKFLNKYLSITGQNAENFIGKGYTPQENVEWWSESMRVFIPESFNPLAQEKINHSPISKKLYPSQQGFRISDNKLIWQLINDGFELGENQNNIPKILESVPDNYKTNFQQGTEAA